MVACDATRSDMRLARSAIAARCDGRLVTGRVRAVYTNGSDGGTSCPPTFYPITTAPACAAAAARLGKPFVGTESVSLRPSGCSFTTFGNVSFNLAMGGAGQTGITPLCTAGAFVSYHLADVLALHAPFGQRTSLGRPAATCARSATPR